MALEDSIIHEYEGAAELAETRDQHNRESNLGKKERDKERKGTFWYLEITTSTSFSCFRYLASRLFIGFRGGVVTKD